MDMKDKKKICSSKKDEKNSVKKQSRNESNPNGVRLVGGNTDAPEGRGSIAAGFLSPLKGVKPSYARLEEERRNS